MVKKKKKGGRGVRRRGPFRPPPQKRNLGLNRWTQKKKTKKKKRKKPKLWCISREGFAWKTGKKDGKRRTEGRGWRKSSLKHNKKKKRKGLVNKRR